MEIRLLKESEIDVRIAQTSKQNVNGHMMVKSSLLLYKDARVDMKILDELFTPLGWKRSHKVMDGNLYCLVEVWDDQKNMWVGKEDVGVESNTEAEKGQASDSFKRACFNWGIGRELYTAPRINITLSTDDYSVDNQGKIKVFQTFYVAKIGYNKAREISSLVIVDKRGNVRFEMGEEVKKSRKTKSAPSPAPAPVPEMQYKPLSDEDYWKAVQAAADGKRTRTGQTIREWFLAHTNAPDEVMMDFDLDVNNYLNAR